MKGTLLGRRSDAVQHFRVLLFEDHLEDVALRLDGLEVRRLFFDEAQSATVHRYRGALDLAAPVLNGLCLLAAALVARLDLPAAIVLFGLGLVGGALSAVALALPRHRLVVSAPGQRIEVPLARSASRRERTLARLLDAVAVYQDRGAGARVSERPEGVSDQLTGTAATEPGGTGRSSLTSTVVAAPGSIRSGSR